MFNRHSPGDSDVHPWLRTTCRSNILPKLLFPAWYKFQNSLKLVLVMAVIGGRRNGKNAKELGDSVAALPNISPPGVISASFQIKTFDVWFKYEI